MGWETRIVWTVVSGIIFRLVWAGMRGLFRVDPAIWLTRRIRITHPRRWAELIRWGLISAVSVALAAVIWGVPIALQALGPQEGGLIRDAAITFPGTAVLYRHEPNHPEVTPGLTLNFYITKSVVVCYEARLQSPPQGPTVEAINTDFRHLIALLDANAMENCYHDPGGPKYVTAFMKPPQFLSDKDIDDVANGQRQVYAIYAWKYYLVDAPSAYYITEMCVTISGNLTSVGMCPGDHNGRTYRHLVN